MTRSVGHHVQLHDPGELLAALPHLLGFHPENSLIVILINHERPARIGATFRLDLPDAEHEECCAERLLGLLRSRSPSAVVLVVVGGDAPLSPGPPRAALLAALTATVTGHGFPVAHALWAPRIALGVRWCCYDDEGCSGTLPDPGQSELAAASTAEGLVTFASRAEVVALLEPEDPAALARRADRLGAAQDAADLDRTLAGDEAARRELRLVLDAVDRAERDRLRLTDDDVVVLATALADHRVRDACLGVALESKAVAAERLWLALTRATPEPERAEPAALLAYSAYARGDGTLAGIAVERALAAFPSHALAGLLRDALECGLEPEVLRRIGRRAAVDAALATGSADTP